MTNLVLHKSEKYIIEDLAYYFSSKRDKHGQIRPSESIYSLTPDSSHLDIDFSDGKTGNLFFPFAPFSIDRIYIGISFPLFANNWGASFLRYLLTRIKPDGCVVLPVYPEMQASEKNYWSRSLLENIFQSRSRWLGTSNIWAENDGVMSMRVGRKWPPKINSTVKYLFSQSGSILVRKSITNRDSSNGLHGDFMRLHQEHWETANTSAIVEKIIQDYFGKKEPVRYCEIGCRNTLLSVENLLSSHIHIQNAVCHIPEPKQGTGYEYISEYFHRDIQERLDVSSSISETLDSCESYHVICFINSFPEIDIDQNELKAIFDDAWKKLASGGILIVYENHDAQKQKLDPLLVDTILSTHGITSYYSSLVASKINDNIEINHYSSQLEQELREENQHKKGVFRVAQKLSA